MFRKLDLLPSPGEVRGTPTQLDPLERAKLSHLISLFKKILDGKRINMVSGSQFTFHATKPNEPNYNQPTSEPVQLWNVNLMDN
jgi:hypothetical protein